MNIFLNLKISPKINFAIVSDVTNLISDLTKNSSFDPQRVLAVEILPVPIDPIKTIFYMTYFKIIILASINYYKP